MQFNNLISYILPYIVVAGNYAKEIQKRILDNNSKDYENNSFSEALTDADLSIQNFIEVCLLAKFPDINFYGEEDSSSLNQKYFLKKSNLTVLVDPIDGTRIYKDGLSGFSIILSIINNDTFLGSIIYFPIKEIGYLAIKDLGSFILSENDMLNSKWYKKLELISGSEHLRTFNQEALSQRLKEYIPTTNVLTDYRKENPCIELWQLFTGELGAFFYGQNAQLIDAAAFAFILEQAGGILSDVDGNPLPKISTTKNYEYTSLVASVNPTIHKKVLNLLNQHRDLIIF